MKIMIMTALLANIAFSTNEYERIFLEARPQIEEDYRLHQDSVSEIQNQLPRWPQEMLERACFSNKKIADLFLRLDTLEENYTATKMAPLCNKYSWGIPNAQAIKTIINYGPLVEMGAGLGYWAHLIHEQGGDIVAYDNFSWECAKQPHTWFEVKRGAPKVLAEHSDRALFLCWPPRDAMAFKSLRNFKGQTLIYVGEMRGGAMADFKFFELLDQDFSEVKSIEIPTWPGYSDKVIIYQRKP